ncbi:DNA-binding protein [Fuerstiella marisgermanici]|uniref:Uncharacterized protein n=1 Tax=Fuerstiella marisgermanici TaxID=1891926 RepID=A0A1P8WP95_9PLAN|nr:hypothetical protein [Fuerstiella marisgermanici]APZ95881.1 hypothetical protein Fuma_05544 [Fuerstiella marisgermanici]
MALTREFIETIKDRADKSPAFRIGLLQEAATAFVTGEPELGRILLRDFVKCTIGFEKLANELGAKSPSVKRMLSAKGNPSSNNLAAIIDILQKQEGVTLDVVTQGKPKPKRSLEKV